jgi:integrase
LFARFGDESGHRGPLSTEIALRWARLPEQATRRYQARRLELVRGLAEYLAPREPGTEVPPRGLLGSSRSCRRAFIFSEAETVGLIEAARSLAPADGLRPRAYATLIGLMACTGLRITEALTLQAGDVDLDAGVLTVRQTKFHKSRLVPLHPSATRSLRDYAAARARHRPAPRDTTFFVSDAGRRLPYGTVRQTFHRLLRGTMPGAASTGRARPRLHDLRHTFACRRLMAWYRDGTDIDRAIDRLSAYLGHAKVTDTYWYLTGIPELLALGRRFEQFAAPAQGGDP